MKLSEKDISKIAEIGSAEVAKALTKLSGIKDISVKVGDAGMVSFTPVMERAEVGIEHPVVAYVQSLSGLGASMMIIEREEALNLLDLVNRNFPGTTGILKDLDSSAVKEILNILSNAYVNTLANQTGIRLDFGVPTMMAINELEEALGRVSKEERDERTLSFRVELVANDIKMKVRMLILFSEKMVDLLKKNSYEQES